MISWESIKKYRKVFNTDSCGYNEPGYGEVLVIDDTTEKGYISTWEETDEEFLDRIERSLKAGRNLFYEEWQELIYEEGWIY